MIFKKISAYILGGIGTLTFAIIAFLGFQNASLKKTNALLMTNNNKLRDKLLTFKKKIEADKEAQSNASYFREKSENEIKNIDEILSKIPNDEAIPSQKIMDEFTDLMNKIGGKNE